MKTEDIIYKLKNSNLYAECSCGGEFKLSDVLLFDGTKPFPPEVKEVQERYEEELKQREEDLDKSKQLATERATITTTAVNIARARATTLSVISRDGTPGDPPPEMACMVVTMTSSTPKLSITGFKGN